MYVNAMSSLQSLIREFNFVANAPTQFFQRDTFPAIVSRIKAKGRKSVYKVELEARYNPAIHPKTGERGKHSARVFLNLLAGKRIKDKSVMPTYNGLLTWCAAKIVTSRARSLEGGLMSQAFDMLEESGAKIESLAIRDSNYSRDDILARRDELLLNLEVGLGAGTIRAVSGRKATQVESDITL
jgi:hypothetical protein